MMDSRLVTLGAAFTSGLLGGSLLTWAMSGRGNAHKEQLPRSGGVDDNDDDGKSSPNLSEKEAIKVASTSSFPEAVVVLGGGRPAKLSDPPAFVKNRCDVAARIYQEARKSGRRVVIVTLSAGSAHTPQLLNEGGRPIWESAASAAYIVKKYGIDPGDIVMETTSYDTIGNAYFARTQICDPMGWRRVWVVTSEFHMPRTQAIFDWIFSCEGPFRHSYAPIRYVSTANVGLTDDALKARKEKEAMSLAKHVEPRARQITTLKGVLLFLTTDHGMYSVKGLKQAPEAVSEELKNSYRAS